MLAAGRSLPLTDRNGRQVSTRVGILAPGVAQVLGPAEGVKDLCIQQMQRRAAGLVQQRLLQAERCLLALSHLCHFALVSELPAAGIQSRLQRRQVQAAQVPSPQQVQRREM